MTNIFSAICTIAYFFGIFGMLTNVSPYGEPGMETFQNPDDCSDIVAAAFVFILITHVPFLFTKNWIYHFVLICLATALFVRMYQW